MSKDKTVVRGRNKISSSARSGSYSVRAKNGVLEVIEKVCPFCGHGKAFKNLNRDEFKCCRCKQWF